ncbi:MAG: sigma factor, partial [Pseudomonadota bacterium]
MEAGWSTAESVARESRGRLVAILAKKLGDVNAAEDALADAFGKALESWPENGVPEHPEAWLIAVAQRRVIDAQRHSKVAAANEEDLAWLTQEYAETSSDTDSRIELLFVCTHPAIDPSIRTPLMLQTVLGVTAEVMAPLWLTPASTIGQRLVRAKSKIAKAAIPFTVPAPHERQQRLDAVLAAIYGALTIGNEDLALEAEYLAALLA